MILTLRHIELWLFKFFCFLSGCWLCFYIQSELHVSAVIAAASIGLLSTFTPNNRRIEAVHIQSTIYSGAFVAMGSRLDQTSVWQLLLVSLIGSTLYLVLDRYVKGLGGKLGLIAFVSTILSLLLRALV